MFFGGEIFPRKIPPRAKLLVPFQDG